MNASVTKRSGQRCFKNEREERMKSRGLVLACAFAVTTAVGANAQEPFYEGKRLDVLINYSAGGSTDIEGRLVAKHLAKHIPGHPEVIVRNMPGAGGLVATNHLGEAAAPDGLTVSYFTAVYEYQLLEDPALTIDLRDLEVIGGVEGVPINYIRKDAAPGIENPEDVVNAEPFLAAGLRPTISKDLLIRMSLDLLDVPHRVITGFKGNAPARQAVQQNEVQFYSETIPAYMSVVVPTMVEPGIVVPLYQHEVWRDGKPMGGEGVPDSIPTFYDLYKQMKGKEPSGQLWEAYDTINRLSTRMLRLIALPPGSPPEAVDDLRQALADLAKDEEFQRDAMKSLNFVPVFVLGEEAEAVMEEQLNISDEMRQFLENYVAEASAN
ncbi:Bug family tripartite tricarboxylate transporter substrate binding protein [Amorphus sp. 3PC139-8]|uniref:Bug family tripartite tricarboxylate transporter substrate binding protein n=1 Tax=Amorphus sp. 3PC139-8 TaxID=2735676 RepID=UPI00345DE832